MKKGEFGGNPFFLYWSLLSTSSDAKIPLGERLLLVPLVVHPAAAPCSGHGRAGQPASTHGTERTEPHHHGQHSTAKTF